MHCGEETPCDVHIVFAEAQVAILERLSRSTVADVLAGSGFGRLEEPRAEAALS
jgi:DNA-binding IscR family transcriptional regulator